MKIYVTSEDIEHGVRMDCTRCPVGLAMWRSSGMPCYVTYFFATMRGQTFRLPLKARDFVRSFDAGLPVKPLEFELPGYDPSSLTQA